MPNPIHICIVTTAHPIDDVRVNNKFAHAFRGAGFRVTWVGPGHAFFDTKDYNRDGIEFVLAHPNSGRLDRVRARGRIHRIAAAVAGVDVYYAPDPDSAEVAARLSRGNGAKVIFDIHENFHGALLDRWLMGWRLEGVREYVRKRVGDTCSRCSLVVGVNDKVLAPYTVDGTSYMVVRSCAPAWFAEGPPSEVCGFGRTSFTIMHGKCGMQRGTKMVLDAVERVSREISGLRVLMFANGELGADPEAQAMLSVARDRGFMDALDLRKGVPMQQMPDILRACDVGLIAYGRNLGVDSLPNRLFEYMAVGIPIIAPAYAVEIAKIVETEKCGLLADFENPAGIADAIVRLRRDPQLCREMGRRAREAFLARHNWEVEVRPLLDRIRNWFPGRGNT